MAEAAASKAVFDLPNSCVHCHSMQADLTFSDPSDHLMKKSKNRTPNFEVKENSRKPVSKAAEIELRLAKLTRLFDEEKGDQSDIAAGSRDFIALRDASSEQAEKNEAVVGPSGQPVVLYLGHIPHGFYEKQMKGFFSQFGEVTRLRLSRSKRTGRSRGYAFIEFESAEVAQIVADTMNNYYLGGRKLVCNLVRPEQIPKRLFQGANKKGRAVPWRRMERDRRLAPKAEEGSQRCLNRLIHTEEKRRQRLAELSIDYEYPGYSAVLDDAYVNRNELKGTTPALSEVSGKCSTAADQANSRPSEGHDSPALGAGGSQRNRKRKTRSQDQQSKQQRVEQDVASLGRDDRKQRNVEKREGTIVPASKPKGKLQQSTRALTVTGKVTDRAKSLRQATGKRLRQETTRALYSPGRLSVKESKKAKA